jgi:hypothetical protein
MGSVKVIKKTETKNDGSSFRLHLLSLSYACMLTVVIGKTMYEVPPGGGGGGGFTMGSSSSLPRIDDVHEANDNPSRKIKAYFSVFILKMILVRHGCSKARGRGHRHAAFSWVGV